MRRTAWSASMRPARLGSWALASLLAACGGNVVFDEEGGDGSGGSGGDGAGSVTSTSVAPSATSASVGGGVARIEAVVVEATVGADCMPVVGPDPIAATVVVEYRNVGTADGTATIDRAELVVANQIEGWVFPLELDPGSPGTIAAGETVVFPHTKVATPGDASFVCQLCGMEGSIQVHFADPAIESSAVPVTLGCAF